MEIGVDIEEISRFEGKTMGTDSHFLNKIFTPRELDYCFSQGVPAQHLAARFCAKEAVIKALNNIIDEIIPCNGIEVLNRKDGSPYINLLKPIIDVDIKISLSHTKNEAIAFAVVCKI